MNIVIIVKSITKKNYYHKVLPMLILVLLIVILKIINYHCHKKNYIALEIEDVLIIYHYYIFPY